MTVGREFVADLERVRAALGHVVPDRSLEKVLHECIYAQFRIMRSRDLLTGGEREPLLGIIRGGRGRPGDDRWRRSGAAWRSAPAAS
jgi:hypothetical protein